MLFRARDEHVHVGEHPHLSAQEVPQGHLEVSGILLFILEFLEETHKQMPDSFKSNVTILKGNLKFHAFSVYFYSETNTKLGKIEKVSYSSFFERLNFSRSKKLQEIPPIEKVLMCGDKGMGAMATTQMIATVIGSLVKSKMAVYTPVIN